MVNKKANMNNEIDHGFWSKYYGCQFPFNINGRQFFYGQSEDDNSWFIHELLPNGTMGSKTAHGTWAHYYNCQFPFKINGRQFFYGQAKEGNNWFIQELLSYGKMGREIDHGFWSTYYGCQFPFYINGRQFFYGQAKEGNNWFIQELSSDGTMGGEIDHGFWSTYYGCQFPFYINGRQFFYGQAKEGNNWFIQELSSNGKMGSKTAHGTWAHYYDSQFHFYIRDNHFLYGQAKEGNNWFIQKLSSNGTMGREIDHGFWAHYYDSQFPFYINGRQFFYGQAKEGKNWFIQEISSCIDDDILSPYHFSDYKIASWNMQGANHNEGKWGNIIANEVKVISNHSNVDIFALQECGALPKSVSTVSDRAPQELISSNNNIELTQNLWALGTNYRPNDVYVYHVENGNQYNRTSMAIVSRYKADEVFIVGPVDNATRPVIGIRRGNDYFFNIHAGAHRNNESPSVISVIENYMSRIVNDNVNATWVIMGDYNTAPDDLRLTNAPLNIERGFAIPASPTHFGGGDRILDYAITGTGIENQATLTTTVSERTLSDHIIVLFIHLFLRPTGRCRRG